MRVLVLCGDRWHPALTARAGLKPLEGSPFTFDWIKNAHEWSAERMAEYPLVVLTKSNNVSSDDDSHWMSEEAALAFREYVRKGNGLVVIHSGSAEYSEVEVLRSLLGGVFASHPPQCAVTIEPLATHPVTDGVTSFTVFDEHYFMDLDDAGADIFMTTTSEHGTQPAGWTRREGEGRVCLLTPGHNVEVWLHPCYQVLIRNALLWCGKLPPAPNTIPTSSTADLEQE